jgi:ankyrin repeat protein
MTYRGAQNLIKRGDEPALRAALEQGLDPNSVNQNGWTLLMLAAVEGNAALGQLLLEFNADPTLTNNKQQTAASIAGDNHAAFEKPPAPPAE